jgi:hypothetical protein
MSGPIAILSTNIHLAYNYEIDQARLLPPYSLIQRINDEEIRENPVLHQSHC